MGFVGGNIKTSSSRPISPEKTKVLFSRVSVIVQAPIICPAPVKTAAILLAITVDILGCIILKNGKTASACSKV
ncbi:hypothetical protein D3C85_1035520 [compost metagenome]